MRYNTGQLGINDLNTSQVVIYKNEQYWVINAGTQFIDTVKVYDTRGRLLIEQKQLNDIETKLMIGEVNQVLLVAITTLNGATVVKKIIN